MAKVKAAPETLRRRLIDLLENFETHLCESDLRAQVKALVPAHGTLRDLGKSLLPHGGDLSARDRIREYLRRFPGEVIDGNELMVVAGISEYARRIRELRVQEGWSILSGAAAAEQRKDIEAEGLLSFEEPPPKMKPDQYMLLSADRDRQAADRWHTANSIRKRKAGVKEKLLAFFRENVGQRITSEELRYIAQNKSEWARRARELRTEEGWPIMTRSSGDPTLPVGVYVLEEDRQSPPHDRKIPEITRREVLKRDAYSCRFEGCGWPTGFDVAEDHRFLELHHKHHHARGGDNSAENLVTLCNLHHDRVHAGVALVIDPI